MAEIVWRHSGANPELIGYADSEILMTKRKQVDVSKAMRDLNYQAIVSLEQGVKNTLDWMKDYYSFENKKTF